MSSDPKTRSNIDGYRLGRSFLSSTRLNLQHYLWKDVLGYNIHPDIPVLDSSNFSIADVGTGTGIWLIDLNRQLSSTRLDGFDISTDQYPPKEWLPGNISLKKLDINEPLPEELVGKYDIVNVRLFLTVVKNDDPYPILKNLVEMLKPGGYLQWSEHNLATLRVESIKPELETGRLQTMAGIAKGAIPQSWPPRLPDSFKGQGLQNISRSCYPVSPELRMFFTHMQFVLGEEYSYAAMDNSDPEKGGPAHRRRIQEAAKQAKEGVAFQYNPEVTIGMKGTKPEESSQDILVV